MSGKALVDELRNESGVGTMHVNERVALMDRAAEIAAARAAFNDPDKKAAWDQFIRAVPPSYRTNRMMQAFDAGWTAGVLAGLNVKDQ